ncbi:MAG: hypothetical protein KDA57_21790 [Planctomycetales bacterium]|nr:hypothetical protein [Planctomycetales bacterium]
MNKFLALLVVLAPLTATASGGVSPSVMGSAAISCEALLGLAKESAARREHTAWVSGRIVAIVPAPVQPFLEAQSFSRIEADLDAACTANPSENLFTVSALLAHDYRVEAEQDPRFRADT